MRWIVAETASDNARILALFRDRGFKMNHDAEGDVVEVVKELPGSGV